MSRFLVAVLVAAAASSAAPLVAQAAPDPDIPRTQEELPTWLLERVHASASGAGTELPFVVVYRYRERLAFYVPPRCCDVMSELYNELGILICRPDGGIAGQGDSRCPGFRENAERLATVRLE